MATTRPSLEEQARLYLRLMARDSNATADFIDIFMPSLLAALRSAFPDASTLDPTVIDNCVIDSLLRFPERPEKFDPNRGALWTYLYVDAKGDIFNALDRLDRQRKREQDALRLVALDEQTRNEQWECNAFAAVLEDDSANYLPANVSLEKVREEVTAILSDATDLAIVELLVAGIRETDRYAAVMNITHRPVVEQRKLVKQAKDKWKKRLSRLGAKINDA